MLPHRQLLLVFSEEHSYTVHGMKVRIAVMEFPFSDEVWSHFRYVIFRELLRNCDVVLPIGGFCWARMSVFIFPW